MHFAVFLILASLSIGAEQPPAAPPRFHDVPVAVPEPSAQAMKFYHSGNVLWVVSEAIGLGIPAFILFSGLSIHMRNIAQCIGRRWFFVLVVYFVLYSLLAYLLRFPLSYYAGFVRMHDYGLSKQTFAKWLYDSLVGQGVEMAFGGLILWVPYLLIYRSPRRWWLYAGLLSLPMMFFVMLVEPIWVAPLFNRFGPMKDKQQEAQILGLAHEAGIDGGRVFEVDMSADTNTVNAYVTGFAATKRIVLWDTLLQKLNPREVRVVMAHEMGHYVLDHVFWGILASCGGVLFTLFLVDRLASWLLNRCKEHFGFDQLSDIASLPLIALLIQSIALIFMPVGLAFSRHIEHEADRFALELTRDNHSAATAFARLQSENLSNPRPGWLYMFWRASHPSLGERIDFANEYRPWEHGETLRYGRLFREPQ